MIENSGINRRTFLSAMAAAGFLGKASAGRVWGEEGQSPESRLGDIPYPMASYPVLQNPKPNEITVVWGVAPQGGLKTTGWVEWGIDPNLGERTRNASFGLNQLSDTFLSASIRGLKPNTAYYYRTATCLVNFNGAYDIKSEEPVYSKTYKFTTPGRKPSTTFAVINDTHENQETLKVLMARIEELNPDQVIWNGDLLNAFVEPKQVIDSVFCPQYGSFAAERFLLFNNGNHDHRGIWARGKSDALTPWRHRNKFSGLGRNFAFRNGPIAFIGLDTGEDKPDANPVFGGLANFEPYRERQAEWLKDVLASKPIASAPFIAAFCHIPIFDANPNANPGDILVEYADWQRPSSKLWGPHLTEAGVQLVVAAHMHTFRYDEPIAERPWAQVVGGGPELNDNTTIIYGSVTNEKMSLTVEKASDRSILGNWEYSPRKKSS